MSKSIGVMGCGWLGFPLAISFIAKGYQVRGTTTSEAKLAKLKKAGIKAFHISLNTEKIEGPIQEFLKDLDVLIINVPPGLRNHPGSSYIAKMRLLHTEAKTAGIESVVFVSSTSVYGNIEGKVTEEQALVPRTESAKQLVESESLFNQDTELSTTVVRFGGLIGEDRHPVNHLAGRTDLTNGDDMVNLIHLDDCIHMISAIIENEWWDQVFNGVFPEHPTKAEYYRLEALNRGLPSPQYKSVSGTKKGKMVISRNFLNKNQQFYTSIYR